MAQKKAAPWVPGTEPYTKQQKAEALKALREKLEGIVGQPATEAQVNVNLVIYEVATLLTLNDKMVELALGSEGSA